MFQTERQISDRNLTQPVGYWDIVDQVPRLSRDISRGLRQIPLPFGDKIPEDYEPGNRIRSSELLGVNYKLGMISKLHIQDLAARSEEDPERQPLLDDQNRLVTAGVLARTSLTKGDIRRTFPSLRIMLQLSGSHTEPFHHGSNNYVVMTVRDPHEPDTLLTMTGKLQELKPHIQQALQIPVSAKEIGETLIKNHDGLIPETANEYMFRGIEEIAALTALMRSDNERERGTPDELNRYKASFARRVVKIWLPRKLKKEWANYTRIDGRSLNVSLGYIVAANERKSQDLVEFSFLVGEDKVSAFRVPPRVLIGSYPNFDNTVAFRNAADYYAPREPL